MGPRPRGLNAVLCEQKDFWGTRLVSKRLFFDDRAVPCVVIDRDAGIEEIFDAVISIFFRVPADDGAVVGHSVHHFAVGR